MAHRFWKWLKKRFTRKKSGGKKNKKLRKKGKKSKKNVCKGEAKPKEAGTSPQEMQGEHCVIFLL